MIKSIEKGYRLPAPMDCPEALYQLMLDSWQKQRTHRPTFSSIVSTLDNLARQPQSLLTTRNSPENDSTHILDTQRGHNIFVSTDLWLESIKMSRYSQHFKEANLLSAQQVMPYIKSCLPFWINDSLFVDLKVNSSTTVRYGNHFSGTSEEDFTPSSAARYNNIDSILNKCTYKYIPHTYI